MTHSLSQHAMKISDGDATLPSNPPGHTETVLLPVLRPDVLAAPEHQRTRQAVAAALFGADSEAVQLGRYRLLSRIGAGGMGIVYAAYDDRLDRKVALKLIRPSRQGGAETAARTLREARALARLSHPNVVHVYEVGELAERQVFVAMEFLAGPTLRAWLDAQPRPWHEVLGVFRQAAEGLAAAHAHGVVHRDFKPESRRPSQTAPQPTNRPHSHKKGRSERGGASRRAPLCPGVDQVLAKPWQQPGPPEDRRGPPTRSPTCTRST